MIKRHVLPIEMAQHVFQQQFTDNRQAIESIGVPLHCRCKGGELICLIADGQLSP